jgi:UDP-glucose 4-epimerase
VQQAEARLTGAAWITGGRGFIGRHLARELSGRGRTVHALGHGAWLEDERHACGVSGWLNASVTAASLDALGARFGIPSVVYHLAGGASVGASLAAPREDFSRTVEATAELAEWIRTRAPEVPVVAVSSAAVYGDAWTTPIPVTAAPSPHSPYGAHKAAMESLLVGHARSFGLRVAIVRLFSVYGPGLEKQLIWDLCCRLAAGGNALKLGGSGDEQRDFLYVADAVSMLAAAEPAASCEPAVFNGGTGQECTVRELAETLVRLWPAQVGLQFDGVRRPGDPRNLVADMRGSAVLTTGASQSVAAGLQQTIASFRARMGLA